MARFKRTISPSSMSVVNGPAWHPMGFRHLKKHEALILEYIAKRKDLGKAEWGEEDIARLTSVKAAGENIEYASTEAEDFLLSIGSSAMRDSCAFRDYFGQWPWDVLHMMSANRINPVGMKFPLNRKSGSIMNQVSGDVVLKYAIDAMAGELTRSDGIFGLATDCMRMALTTMDDNLKTAQEQLNKQMVVIQDMKLELEELRRPDEKREQVRKQLKIEIQKLQERKWRAEKRMGVKK